MQAAGRAGPMCGKHGRRNPVTHGWHEQTLDRKPGEIQQSVCARVFRQLRSAPQGSGAEALNNRNSDAVAPGLHPASPIIRADNQKPVGLDALKKFSLALFDGPNPVLSKFETRVTADDETRFIDAGTGVVYG